MSFFRPLRLEYLDGRRWRLFESFGYSTRSGRRITVPKGFNTDFASVPRMFWRIFPPTGEGVPYGKAAVIHDFLYATNGLSREAADRIFLEAMTDLKVGWFTRRTLWLAVRLGGWAAWNVYRKKVTK